LTAQIFHLEELQRKDPARCDSSS